MNEEQFDKHMKIQRKRGFDDAIEEFEKHFKLDKVYGKRQIDEVINKLKELAGDKLI